MRLISYASASGPRVAAVLPNGFYVDLQQADSSLPSDITQLLALGHDGLRRAALAVTHGQAINPAEVQLLPPVPRPEKIFCIGLNYADHARETGKQPPPEPVVFNKFVTALRAAGEPIVLPRLSEKVDYEAELVVVIGKPGRHIPKQQALEHVAGYTCGNDISARDWQNHKPGGQWLLGKSFDSFAPLGPELVTADELPDAGNLQISLRINGHTMQDSRTSQLIFGVADLISYISGVCTFSPGDLIYTGTPPGVGFARKPPVYLQPGDVVEVEIERIGKLRNPVVAER
ncbi:MAG TPA: fumarylacetoacetate hydrolase family protein [Pirellulales bacterium]|jgi:2-keto-4-pentenoate hydratase/2-oxohepta-3-ene-1,7-dioic acid hydratase in catechol pathway|nr:fumarylacetoacetate hydrolase family protein [Pirellulales bacterium]